MLQGTLTPATARELARIGSELSVRTTAGALPGPLAARIPGVTQALTQYRAQEREILANLAEKPFTDAQLAQLRAQVDAYRTVAKNEPLAPEVLRRIAPVPFERQLPEPGPLPPVEVVPLVPPTGFERSGLPLNDVVAEREYRVASRMAHRVNELQNLPAHKLPRDLRVKAKVELLALKLVDFQRQLRAQIVAERPHFEAVTGTALARKSLRARKRQLQKDAKSTERQELRQREEIERRKRAKHADYLNGILAHGRAFREFHKDVKRTLSNICRAVQSRQSNAEREAQREAERQEKERIRRLMEKDEAGYRAMIDEKKHARLAHLLNKTDEYMASMEATIRAHQELEEQQNKEIAAEAEAEANGEQGAEAAAAAAAAPAPAPPQRGLSAVAEDDEEDMRGFGSAHRIVEKVHHQPELLKNGTLKEYQLRGLEWLVSLYNNKLNGILADEMGLGKTIQTIALLCYLVETKKNRGPFLIIVPLATLSNWVIEFEKWAPDLIPIVYRGNPHQRKALHATIRELKFNVLVTTYEYILKDRSVLGRVPWKYMIVDEGHRMKNHNCKLTQVQ